MKRPRICIDARMIDGAYGGIQQFILGLVSGLSKIADYEEDYYILVYRGHEQWLLPYMHDSMNILYDNSFTSSNGMKHYFGKYLKPSLSAAYSSISGLPIFSKVQELRLPKSSGIIEENNIDIMHFTCQRAFLTKVPSIYHPHDLQHVHLSGLFTAQEYKTREVMYKNYCEQSSMISVTSSWGKKDLIEHYGLPEKKIQVIPLAPLTSEYATPSEIDMAMVRNKYALPEKFIFYPAQTWQHKNHLNLLEALAILRDDYRLVVPLVCSGRKSAFYSTIEQRIRELQLEDQVKFLGFVETQELSCLYRMSHAVIIPTKFEAASFPIWEAFEVGVPVSASNVTSLPEQVGEAALLFDPERSEEIALSIFKLWTDDRLCTRLIQEGKRNVAHFSWVKTAQLFRAHYRRISGNPLSKLDYDLVHSPPLL